MRILCCTEAFWPRTGGIETFTDRFTRGLAAAGHEVTILTSQDDQSWPAHERRGVVKVHRLPLVGALQDPDPGKLLSTRAAVRSLHRQLAPDVVHVAFPGVAGYYALRALEREPAPMLLRVHTLWPGDGGRHEVFHRLLDAAGWVTTVSGAALADVRRFHPSVADRASVVHSGVDRPALDPGPLPHDPAVVLALGRLAPEKGIDVLLRAMTAVEPPTRLVVVGDGPERAGLSALATSLGLDDRVDWVGAVAPELVWDHLQRATVVAIPSRSDAFPRAAIEAAHLGRAVVATRIGGLVESVLDGETGLLVPPDDPPALAAALQRVLTAPALAAALGAAGRRHAERFSMVAAVDAHLDRYAHLIR